MSLTNRSTVGRPLFTAAVVVLGGLLVYGCRRDDTVAVDRNLPPETYITDGPEASPDPENPTDLFYRAHLYWRGEDRDGTIAGFRFAIDDTSDSRLWKWTTRTDSTFLFQAGEVGSREHLFLIRAVDNEGKQDATPDTLRFEAFTAAAPVVLYTNDEIQVSNSGGTYQGLAKGDTVLVNSTISFRWSGTDADGEIVRWETIFGAEQAVEQARDDTTRTIGPLSSGRHDFLVRAIDDAGAVSTSGGLFPVISNFDPNCRIDSTSIESRLDITWLDSNPDVDSVLVTTHDLTQSGAQDTIPFGATVSFCWECEDPDGPIVSYDWKAGFVTGRSTDLCIDTDSLCAFDPDSGYVVCRSRPLGSEGTRVDLQIKGRDIYGRVQGITNPTFMQLNYAPRVTITPPAGPIHATTAAFFSFSGTDLDSDAADLGYRWWFDAEVPPGTFVTFPAGGGQTNPRLFAVGPHALFVQAVDQSGLERPSPTARLDFDVVP